MKNLAFLFILFFGLQTCGQVNLSGKWQGVMIRDGYTIEKGIVVYAEFEINNGQLTGRIRNDLQEQNAYSIKKVKGTIKENAVKINEFVVEKKYPTPTKITWCMVNMDLNYSDSTGYLKGKYSSSDCKRNNGTIILYRDRSALKPIDEPATSHHWFKSFITNVQKGYNAPEVLEKERSEFKFEPIYFDYDKDILKPEYFPFLRSMIRMVESHSDLRIKITGHTDSDGSDTYNEELSKRRAEAIVDFFMRNGLSRDRIVIDFKGEKEPVDSNKTEEGKQRNRRVDFSFI
jgi:OmpA-OmpF porin, OOP family